jgi:hypothetical protein
MISTTLHQVSPEQSPEVEGLDAFLNSQLASAASSNQEAYWWNIKVKAKRLLSALDDHAIPSAAADILRELRSSNQ